MANKIGTYKIPSEFKDEDKWFKFFTLPQLFGWGGVAVVSYFIYNFFASFGLSFIGVCTVMTLLIFAWAFMYFTIPTDKYLIGGGIKARVILLRVLKKKRAKNRVIYCKNYERED